MSDGETPETDERTVSVFAPETDPRQSVPELLDDDRVVVADSATVATGTDAVVAVGDGALSTLAAAGVSTPVLPAGTAHDTPTEPVSAALDRFFDGTDDVRERPVVRVETSKRTTDAVFDVSLTAAEPGLISEFTIEREGDTGEATEADTEDRIARFRADGVVVATPAGSRGYARAAGGPVVLAGSDVLTVVPIAPFATDPDHWVVSLSSLSITVERDVDVSLTVDGRPFTTLSPGVVVRLARAGTLRFVDSPELERARE